jgi:hypothetical protein
MNFPINIEQWRLIDGYDNYEVSSHGRVRKNTNGYIMKLRSAKGYLRICLSRDSKQKNHPVHRLVAFAFLDRNEDQTDVDHIDHNKENNMVNNLRWVTSSVNQRNRSLHHNSSSGISGVNFHKGDNSW